MCKKASRILSEKGSTLKEKNLLPLGVDPFRSGLMCKKASRSHKSCLRCKNAG